MCTSCLLDPQKVEHIDTNMFVWILKEKKEQKFPTEELEPKKK